MLSLHKKIESNWKEYANMKVPVKVLRLLPWRKKNIYMYYHFTSTERAKRARKKKKKKKKTIKKQQQHFVSFLKKGK